MTFESSGFQVQPWGQPVIMTSVFRPEKSPEYALQQWSPTVFLERYLHEDFSSNHNRVHLTI